MHDSEGQCAIGAGLNACEVVGVAGRRCFVGIDAPDLRAVLARKVDVVAEVNVGGEHADAPKKDEVAISCFLWCGGQRAAHDIAIAAGFSWRTDGAVKARRTELIEKAVAGAVLDGAHGAGIGVGQDGLGTILTDDGFPLISNGCDCRLPANRCKAATSLGANALERCRKPLRGVHRAFVVGHLGAKRTARITVAGIALHLDDLIVLGIDEQSAAVRAVVGAGGFFDFHVDTSIVFITLYYTTRN